MTSDDRPRRHYLALAGGNALGAHAAGAIEALELDGQRIDVISGAFGDIAAR